MAKVDFMTRTDIRRRAVVKGAFEILDWFLYDQLTIPNGNTTTQFKFFQRAIGNPVGTTKRMTNMTIPGQLPDGYRMVVQKIVLDPSVAAVVAGTYLDQAALTSAGAFEFNIGTRQYLEGFIKALIGGVLVGFGANAAAYAGPRTVVNGEMEYAPVIPSTFNFDVTLTYDVAPNPAVAVNMNMLLIGKLIRPMQG